MRRFDSFHTLIGALAGLALASAALLAAPSTALAEHNDDEVVVITTTPVLTTTTVAMGVAFTMADSVSTTSSSSSSSSSSGVFPCAQTTDYIRHNGPALEQGIAMGGGEAVADLATMGGIAPEDQAAFGKLLRAERERLAPLLDPHKIDEERTEQFDTIIAEAMRQNTHLAHYVRG